ncbi:MAG: alpha/beta fold hydrolase, partial [Acidimicrobiales bacterium]|nr:alpha/beta fold hydrolase [Acidimicrobiales bacterium]
MTGWIEIDGMRLRHLDVAPRSGTADGPPVLIIPGHTARIEGYLDLVDRLCDRRRVLVLDCPGSGESAKPVRRYDLRFYEDTLVAYLDALGIERAVPVGGSLGGNLVLRLGHRFPERFDRLVLWAPGSAWPAKRGLAAFTQHVAAPTPLGRLLFWPTVRIQSRFWYDPAFEHRQQHLDETFGYYRRIMSPGFLRMYWGMAADQLGRSLFDLAPEIRQPTLLMWGDR